jgi:hypothetical protein
MNQATLFDDARAFLDLSLRHPDCRDGQSQTKGYDERQPEQGSDGELRAHVDLNFSGHDRRQHANNYRHAEGNWEAD